MFATENIVNTILHISNCTYLIKAIYELNQYLTFARIVQQFIVNQARS